MMFETLSDKLASVFKKLSGKGKLTEKDVDEAMREVRVALLEADVNFKVVKNFVAKVRERSVGTEVLESLTPAQQVIKIVNEELITTLGGGQHKLKHAPQPPTIILLVGLQGAGKITTCAKLAVHLKKGGQRVLMVAADPYRPAARDQLLTLGRQIDVPVYVEGSSTLDICTKGLKRAREIAATTVLVDTAGRLHVDDELMKELRVVGEKLHPTEVLLVADAMTGQEAVRIAEEFNSTVGLTGIVLSKMDGDARGGAALSIASVTGVPLKFIGVGEKTDALEPFHPDRVSSRILGMGDIISFIEKAEATTDAEQRKQLEQKLRRGTFDLEDFLEQLRQIRKMGPISQLLEMVPGVSGLAKKMPHGADEKQMRKVEAMILSMTPDERQNPVVIDGSRRRRIARGSGTTPQDVNQLLNQHRQVQKLMKQLGRGNKLASLLKRR
ncbi:MAG: signal recognition particle protein [Dehalococcoidia bacterium]|nr:signal recognition particle protein [Dehalococcoidia bacterium]